MGFFGFLKGKKEKEEDYVVLNRDDNFKGKKFEELSEVSENDGILNLKKNQYLSLDKSSKINMDKNNITSTIKVSCGWDMVKLGNSMDLDLSAYIFNKDVCLETVYFGHMKSRFANLFLDEDNLTGEGDGDDENIYLSLDEKDIDPNITSIYFSVNIFNAKSKHQNFGMVKNAYIRLSTPKGEVCRHNLDIKDSKDTTVVFAKIEKINGKWSFVAIGDFFISNHREISRIITQMIRSGRY